MQRGRAATGITARWCSGEAKSLIFGRFSAPGEWISVRVTDEAYESVRDLVRALETAFEDQRGAAMALAYLIMERRYISVIVTSGAPA